MYLSQSTSIGATEAALRCLWGRYGMLALTLPVGI